MLVKEVRAKIPIKTIPNIIGDTAYKAINELREATYANADAIPTTLEEERNVNVGLLMDVPVYVNVAATAYTRPTEPGLYAQYGVGNSAAARADANVIHTEAWRIYYLDENVDAALKQYFIAAVE